MNRVVMFGSFKTKLRMFLFRFKYRHLVHISQSSVVSNTQFEGKNAIAGGAIVNNCYMGLGSYIAKHSNIINTRIGRFCSIADNVNTIIGNHPIHFVTTHPSFYYDTTSQIGYTFHKGKPLYDCIFKFPEGENRYQIVIGNDVWIGSHVLLLSGIKIGDGAVIAAGAVVTKDVQPYTVVGGVPAKIIRYRFSQDIIEQSLNICWWNLPHEEIRKLPFNNINKCLELLK